MKQKDLSHGQRTHKCDVAGCQEFGRTLAKLGGIPIYYCPKHRKRYGERIVNALVNSLFNYKLSNYMAEVKHDIFFDKEHLLCEDCAKRVNEYILNKTSELDSIIEYATKNEMEQVDEEELDKIEVDDGN